MENNHPNKYQLICGLEIHAELATQSKMFCGCKNDPFGAKKPNIYTCPVCLAMPGGLPVANKKAIEWTIQLGLALHCQINLFSHFDRKHYFYPDLPKGYQISQYDQPFCYAGYLETSEGKVRITRIHLEEDTAKLLHQSIDGNKASLIDFNRGGVPLAEIVSEPDIVSATQAVEYAKALRQIIRYLEIGECNMEQGGMRLEANISLRKSGVTTLPNYKVEVKNINSFRFLEQAITYEIDSQTEILNTNQIPAQETKGYDAIKGVTFRQRTKETAADYRYFPDPDLPPLEFTESQIEDLRTSLPELPTSIVARWQTQYQIAPETTKQLLKNQRQSKWLESLWLAGQKVQLSPSKLASAIINKKLKIDLDIVAEEILTEHRLGQQSETIDANQLQVLINDLVKNHPAEVHRYQSGETKLLGFFIGQLKNKLPKAADMSQLTQILRQILSK